MLQGRNSLFSSRAQSARKIAHQVFRAAMETLEKRQMLSITPSIFGPASVNEGSPYNLSLNSTGTTPTSWSVNWGDGNVQAISGNPSAVQHVYADGLNNYSISASATNSEGTFAAKRWLIDSSFGNSGSLAFSLNGYSGTGVKAFAAQADGKIVAIGTGSIVSGQSLNDQIVLVRLNADGTVDSGWGTKLLDFNGANDEAAGVTIDPATGNIIVAANSNGDFSVARYTPSGALDPTFASGGKVVVDMGSTDIASGVIVQSDGKIVVAGTSNGNFALLRLNIDGSLDNSFGSGGKIYTDFGSSESAAGVVLQSDGKIVVAGTTNNNFALARYNTDGSLDSSFGTGGKQITDLGSNENATSIALQSDGKIILGGSSNGNFIAARYNSSNGALDSSFGSGGIKTIDFGGGDAAASVLVQPDGKIWIAGNSQANFAPPSRSLARLNPDGSLDATFDGDGKLIVGSPTSWYNAMILEPSDGKLLMGYWYSVQFVMERLTTSTTVPVQVNDVAPTVAIYGAASVNEGAPYTLNLSSTDPGTDAITSWSINWGDGNTQTISGNPSSVQHVYADGPNSFTISASATNPQGTFAAKRWAVDTTFGTAGTINSAVSGTAYSVITQADGKIVVAGQGISNNGDFVLQRYNVDSTLDTAFGSGGTVSTDLFSGSSDSIAAIIQQPDGKIVAAGSSNGSFALVRYNADGTLDLSFNGTGKVTTAFSSSSSIFSVALQIDGKIVVAGAINNGSANAIVRYNADGSLDATFNGSGELISNLHYDSGYGPGVAVQADGKIILGGSLNGDVALARFNSNGSVDSTFGTGGVVTKHFFGIDAALGVIVQPDGKILAKTQFYDGDYFGLLRFNSNGTLDTTFGSGGVVMDQNDGWIQGSSFLLQSDGKIVVPAASFVLRYNSNGSPDVTFNGGKFSTGFLTYGVTLQADGKVVAVGAAGHFVLARFGAVGAVPATQVNDVAPTVGIFGPNTVNEGATYTLNLSASDPGQDTINSWVVNWGDGNTQTISGNPPAAQHVYTNGPSSVTISATASNEDGTFAANTIALDTTFGAAGTASVNLGGFNTNNNFNAMLRLSNGKVLLAGSHDGDMAVIRTNADGTLDTTFGVGGWGKADFVDDDWTDYAYYMAVQNDGKIVLAGASNASLALARFNSDGTLDTTFNGTGLVRTNLGLWTQSGLAITSSGKILALANGFTGPALVRFNTDGSLDNTFGSGGELLFSGGNMASMAIQSDDKIVVGGNSANTSASDFQLRRFNSDGTVDNSFGSAGAATLDLGAQDSLNKISVQPDGKIVAAGISGTNTALARFNADGTLDTGFGSGGKTFYDFGPSDTVRALSLLPDGRIIALGSSFLASLSSSGILQSDSGWNGKQAVMNASTMLVQPDGQLLLGGLSGTNYAVSRYKTAASLAVQVNDVAPTLSIYGAASVNEGSPYTLNLSATDPGTDPITSWLVNWGDGNTQSVSGNPSSVQHVYVDGLNNYNISATATNQDGTFAAKRWVLDSNFGAGGKVTTDLGSSDGAQKIVIQPDGKTIAAGYSNGNFAITRYNTNGTLDTTFGSGGKVITDFGSYESANSLALQSDGRIIVVGSSNGDFAVARYFSNGVLDATFGSGGKVVTDLGGYETASDVAIQTDGKIVVAGWSNSDFALARYNADGSLDSGFGTGGKVVTDLGTMQDNAYALALQSDGKIVVTGWTYPYDFAIVRYNTNGSLDTSFGTNGKTVVDLGSDVDFAESVAIQPDGKILIGGTFFDGGGFGIIRLNSNGTLDTNFGANGKVITSFGGDDSGYSLILLPDGKFLEVGNTSTSSTGYDFSIARYNSNGSLDTTFDNDGKLSINFNGTSNDFAHSVAVQPDGSIVIAGTSNGDFAIARLAAVSTLPVQVNDVAPTVSIYGVSSVNEGAPYTLNLSATDPGQDTIGSWSINWGDGNIQTVTGNPSTVTHSYDVAGADSISATATNEDGTFAAKTLSLDVGFDGDGVLATTLSTNSITAFESDDKIVVASNLFSSILLTRYNANGTLDTTFDGDGQLTVNFGSGGVASAVKITPDNHIVVVGYNSANMMVARYNPNGSPDTTFDSDGLQTINFGTQSFAYTAALQSDGKIVLAGTVVDPNYDFAMARLTASGALDTTFNGTGKVTGHFSTLDAANAMVIQSDGKILVADSRGDWTNNSEILRYNTNGTLDTSFDGDGIVDATTGPNTDIVVGLGLQSDGKIIAQFTSSNIVRYTASGAVDTTFNGTGQINSGIGQVNQGTITVQPDDKILLLGFSGQNFLLERLTASGSLDPSFGANGKIITGVIGNPYQGSVALQPDGKIYFSGYVPSTSNYAVIARYAPGTAQTINVTRAFTITGPTQINAGTTYNLTLNSTNSNSSIFSDWTINWGDGSTLTYHVNPTRTAPVIVSHDYAPTTSTYVITGSAVDNATASQTLGPINLTITGNQPWAPIHANDLINGSTQHINWTQPAGPANTGYVIQYSPDGLGNWQDFATITDPNARSYDAYIGRQYYFRIRATSNFGDSQYTPIFTPAGHPENPIVEVTADVQSSPAQITLKWTTEVLATGYTIYRRLKGATSWSTPIGTVGGSANSFVDTTAVVGTNYEYRVDRSGGNPATGYVSSGIALPLVENRGKIILIVDNTFTTSLAGGLAQLQQDLVGDGWTVIRHDVSRTASVTSVKALIQADYNADPTNVKQVLLFGHVPVPYSGNLNPDGHSDHLGAWPADTYYADMNGTWTDSTVDTRNNTSQPGSSAQINIPGDGKFDQNDLSGDRAPELAVGRVDLSDMGIDETAALQQYLARDHNFRTGALTVRNRAIIDTNFPFSSAAYASFSGFVGSANIDAAKWFPNAVNNTYLWGAADGPGGYNGASGVGTTFDFLDQGSNVVFTTLFGSYFGDWNTTSNFLRAPLAAPGLGLTSAWGSRPDLYYYPMDMGETIGYATVFNETASQFGVPGGTYMALMGDPSLQSLIVAPATNVNITKSGNNNLVNWTASTDNTVLGYNIYRSTSVGGTFTKLNTSTYVNTTTFNDTTAAGGNYVYMVRAIKLQQSMTGTYYEASDGAFRDMNDPNSASFVGVDTTAQGTWKGTYGSQGYNIIGDAASIPSYAQVTPSGKSDYTWASSTSDARALQLSASGSTSRIASTWYSPTSFSVDVNITDGLTHALSLYLLDWDGGNSRAERVDVIDPLTGQTLLTQNFSSFSAGQYLKLRVGGHVTIKITNTASPNAVLSGLFFDA
jgi:uncharacterized delta-60 repeat protein